MKTVHVDTGRPYDIFIERGIIDCCGEHIKRLSNAEKVVVVSDTNVAPLYQWRVLNSLSKHGLKVNTHIFHAGEESKNPGTIAEIYKTLAEFRMTRRDVIVALGGGVCGDMAGFAAATYLRGIDFVQIPTTLLSQVDSSVGGKTGVDLPTGKNLVGAFWQPRVVLIDPDTLSTLPAEFFNDGMGEVIKYGCIRSRSLFERLENENARDIIDDIIFESVSIKKDVVEHDERDTGERAILNFGHTFGHALEKLHNYSGITHGEAVALGALLITRITEQKGITEKGSSDRLLALLKKYHMTTTTDFTLPQIVAATRGDKKSSGKGLSFIFLRDIGTCFINKISTDKINDYFCNE